MLKMYGTFEGFVHKIVRCFGLVNIMTPVEYKYHEFNVLDVQKKHL